MSAARKKKKGQPVLGVDKPVSGPRSTLVSSWPGLFVRELTVVLALSALLLLLALLVEAPLGPLASPTEPDNPEKAPWYFVGVQEMVSYSASSGVLLFPAALVVALLLIPMVERRGSRTGLWFADSGAALALLAALAGAGTSALGLWLWETGRLSQSGLDPALLLLVTAVVLASLALWRRRSLHAAGVALVVSCLAG